MPGLIWGLGAAFTFYEGMSAANTIASKYFDAQIAYGQANAYSAQLGACNSCPESGSCKSLERARADSIRGVGEFTRGLTSPLGPTPPTKDPLLGH